MRTWAGSAWEHQLSEHRMNGHGDVKIQNMRSWDLGYRDLEAL